MKKTLWCLTEEQVSFDIVNLIKWVCDKYGYSFEITGEVDFNVFLLDNKVSFEITGLNSDVYHRFIYTLVEKKGNGFVDYLFYEGDNFPVENTKPIAVAEGTKNNGKESGNMSDQRSPKLIPILEKWGKIPYAYLISNYESKENISKSFSQSHKCAFATICAINGDVLISTINKFGYKKYDLEFKYESISDIVLQEGKKKSTSGVPSRVLFENNEVIISANINKKGGEHDPGVGYVSSRSYLVRMLNPNIKIKIKNHQKEIEYFKRDNNKFINVMKLVGVTVIFNDNTEFDIERKSGIFDKPYWKYANSGEKIATIIMEKIFEKKGWQVLFTNHAGCGKSYRMLNGNFDKLENKKGIPDLVLYKKEENRLMVIEGETSKNYKKGIKQVNDVNFDEFIKTGFLNFLPNETITEKYISTYGEFNNEDGVIFNITENLEVNIREDIKPL
jgi:hypothetical protein